MTTLTLSNYGQNVYLGSDTPGQFTDGRLSGSDNINATVVCYVSETALSSTSYTYSGLLSGFMVFTHSVGTLEITGANTYTGGTYIKSGTLILDKADSAGTGTISMSGGTTLLLNSDIELAPSLSLGDAFGTYTIGNLGHTITLTGSLIPHAGSATVAITGGGTTILTGASVAASATFAVSPDTKLQIGAGAVSGSLSADIIDDGALIFSRTGSLTFSKVISGTGSVTQAGTGTIIFTGANSYSGTTTISAGTLQVGNGGESGEIGSGDINNNGTLVINRSGIVTLAQHISGTGAFRQSGTGTTQIVSDNTYAGATTISSGTLQIGTGGTSGSLGSGNVIDDATLVFDRGDAVTFGNAISGTGTLSQIGAGTLVLTGANTYSGTTTINAGVLQIGNGGSNGSLGPGNITDDAAIVLDRSGTLTLSNSITGTGTISQIGSGTTVLTGTNTYGGTTTISAGTLQVGNGGTSGSLGTGAVVDNAALSFNRSDLVTSGNIISGTGSLTQAGAGTLVLQGTNTYSGGTQLLAGTLDVHSASGAGTGAITFGAGPQVLKLEAAAIGGGSFANVLKDFGDQDSIDIVGLMVTSASLGAGNTLTLTSPSHGPVTLHFDPSADFANSTFSTATDGNGGTLLTLAHPSIAPAPTPALYTVEPNAYRGIDITVLTEGPLPSSLGSDAFDILIDTLPETLTLMPQVDAARLGGDGGTMIGNALSNVFTVQSGSWVIDGGIGYDVLQTDNKFADCRLEKTKTGFTLTYGGEVQVTTNIEGFEFADAKIVLDTSPAAIMLGNLYQSAFGRSPDPMGLGYWLDQYNGNMPATDLAHAFLTSAEWSSHNGRDLSDRQFIEALYTNILHRAPDADGFAFWTGALSHASREATLLSFVTSAEEAASTSNLPGNGAYVGHFTA